MQDLFRRLNIYKFEFEKYKDNMNIHEDTFKIYASEAQPCIQL